MVMLMTCWSLESKIDSSPLKPVIMEYLTEILMMPEFHPDLLIIPASSKSSKIPSLPTMLQG